jgi:Na+-driven multidrug efflux pump
LITVGCAWFVKIPVSMALVWGLDLGALGAWLALGAEIMVVAGLACWRIRGAAWLQQHRQEAQALREAA